MDERSEWLEPDGLGGFASGTATGVRTRRYHAILLAATQPPAGRMVLVNGLDVWVETPAGRFPLSSQRYLPALIHPDGAERLVSFDNDPWPRWTYELEDKTCQPFVRNRDKRTANGALEGGSSVAPPWSW